MASRYPIDKNGLTPMQEKFCQEVAKGSTYSEAYRLSYGAENYNQNSLNVQASKMMSDPKILLRVDELRSINAERNAVTVESITKELNEQIVLASGEKQHSASIKGIDVKAKLHGLVTTKVDHTTKGEKINPEKASLIKGLLEKL